jgi:hypothetical protein
MEKLDRYVSPHVNLRHPQSHLHQLANDHTIQCACSCFCYLCKVETLICSNAPVDATFHNIFGLIYLYPEPWKYVPLYSDVSTSKYLAMIFFVLWYDVASYHGHFSYHCCCVILSYDLNGTDLRKFYCLKRSEHSHSSFWQDTAKPIFHARADMRSDVTMIMDVYIVSAWVKW